MVSLFRPGGGVGVRRARGYGRAVARGTAEEGGHPAGADAPVGECGDRGYTDIARRVDRRAALGLVRNLSTARRVGADAAVDARSPAARGE